MSAPGMRRRLRELKERGGRLVVIDPRRSETARAADVHHSIRPGSDALLLAALVRTILDEDAHDPGAAASHPRELDQLRAALAPFTPDRVAGPTGIPVAEIRALALDFARAPSAVCYGRMGTCTQAFGASSTWLIDLLNIVTGNLDRPGGAMFTTPAVDLAGIAAALGQSGSFDRWRSRVGGLPEFNGELPAAAFADEMEQEGPGRIRALLLHAGNPALSLPNGPRLERAFAELEFVAAIDLYVNESTRHAHIIIPPTFGLERDHYPLIFHATAVRNTARYARAVLPAADGMLHDWEILLELSARMLRRRGGWRGLLRGPLRALGRAIGPRGLLALTLRLGPHGAGLAPWGRGLTLASLEADPHGVDLGPLEPRLPEVLATEDSRIHLCPDLLMRDLDRLAELLDAPTGKPGAATNGDGPELETTTDATKLPEEKTLILIGRRHLHSNNSWMHNCPSLASRKERCTLLVHPRDAEARGLRPGERARLRSRVGEVETLIEVSDEIMPGVVSLPHGWGHDRPGLRMGVAGRSPGVSANDLTDDRLIDPVAGTTDFSGVTVTLERIEAAHGARSPASARAPVKLSRAPSSPAA
jgi:anaerobic selenocysteine-containing dehydrogenase